MNANEGGVPVTPPTREPTGFPNLDDFMDGGSYYSLPMLRDELSKVLARHERIVDERDAAVRERDEEKEARAEWEEESAAWSRQCLKVQEECAELRARLAECEKIVEAVAAIDPTIYNRRGDVIALSQAANVATETFRAAVAAETQGEKV